MIDREQDLLDSILAQQRQSWLAGNRPCIEDLLRDSSLRDDSEAKLDAIYNEVVVREEPGENPSAEEYTQRYPHLVEDIDLHFEVHRAVEGRLPSLTTGLHLERDGCELRLWNPATGAWLPTHQEAIARERQGRQEAERRSQEAERARQEAEQSQQETERRLADSEAEIQRLRRQLGLAP